MRKKAQLTTFVIIAILIIAIVIAAYVFYTQQQKSQKSQQEINFVKQYINDCLNKKTKQAVLSIARHSGYFEMPNNSINFLDEKAVYYLKNNNTLVPNKTVVENQISLWLNNNIEDCFSVPRNIVLEKRYCNIKTRLSDITSVDFDCKIEIKINEKTFEINKFDSEVNVSLLPLISASREIVESYKETEPNYICIDCLDEIASKYNINITVIPVTKDIYAIEHVWFLLNSSKKIDDKFLIWRFVTDLR